MNSEDNKIAIICITENGKSLAIKLQEKLNEGQIYFVKKKKDELESDVLENGIVRIEQKLKEFVPTVFDKYRYIVFIMATGIVVRTIAPLIQSKFDDPAIIVTDEKGTNVISLLSGHMGGANEMTLYISNLIGSNPVITTATDVNNKSSLDMIAKKLNAHIDNFRDSVLKINSMIVNNEPIGLFIDGNYDVDTRGFEILKREDVDNKSTVVVISDKKELGFKNPNIIKVVPRDIVMGIGCKKNIDYMHMKNSLKEFLDINNIDINSIKAVGSIEIKKHEEAIIKIAQYLNVPFEIFTIDEISKVDYLYKKSEWVKKNVGVYSVAEPCAHLLSGGNLIIEKQKYTGITFSAGRVK